MLKDLCNNGNMEPILIQTSSTLNVMRASSLEPHPSPSLVLLTDDTLQKPPEQNKMPIINEKYNKVQCVTDIDPADEEYKMNHESQGKAFIFNHRIFDDPDLAERHGTEADKNALQETFMSLGFQVNVCDDLTLDNLKFILGSISQEDHSNRNSLVVAVMTHGDKNGLLNARDQKYNIDLLLSYFIVTKCPSLVGKPKIFIIQACQGEQVFEVSTLQSVHYNITQAKTKQFYFIPLEADILLTFSNYAGHKSHRHQSNGTWFIQELCKELHQNAKSMDALSMLTNVTRHVAIEKEYLKGKQIPVIQSTLTRKLFLFPPSQREPLEVAVDLPKALIHDYVPKRRYGIPWDILRAELPCVKRTHLPDPEVVFRLGTALRLFLQQNSLTLSQDVCDSGEGVLLWLSMWDKLDVDLQCYVYHRLVRYLKTNANDWEYFKVLYIPKDMSQSLSSVVVSETHVIRRSHNQRQSGKKKGSKLNVHNTESINTPTSI